VDEFEISRVCTMALRKRAGPTDRPHSRVTKGISSLGTGAKALTDGDIVRNAASLYGTTVITSALGFVYWFIAARMAPASAVGAASALQSAAQFLSIFCVFGLSTLLISELSQDKREARSLILTATSGAGVFALVVTTLVGLGLLHEAHSLRSGLSGFDRMSIFVLLGAVTTMLLVLDDSCIGLSRADLQLKRNAVFSVAKLAILPPLILAWRDPAGAEMVLAWLVGLTLSLGTLGIQLTRLTPSQSWRPDPGRLFAKRHLMLGHHWLNLSVQSSRLIVPVLVAIILGTRANAAYTAALLLVGFVNIIPVHLSTVLFALSPGDEAALGREVPKTMRICLILALLSAPFFVVLARPILTVFGPAYVRASLPLAILGFTTYPSAIKSHYVAIARVRGRMRQAAFRTMIGALLEIGLAAAGGYVHGLTGVAGGFLLGTVVEAAIFSPTVFGVLRSSRSTRGIPPPGSEAQPADTLGEAKN
jgi:O-antigen/teichoic acid export membrane protein